MTFFAPRTRPASRRLATAPAAMVLCGFCLVAGCVSPEGKPKDLRALRNHLLEEAKKKYEHALRITERHSPDPFNQAREQLVYTLIEMGAFAEAERRGREFLGQKIRYLDAARSRLAEIELDWKKELAGNPEAEGTKKEEEYLDLKHEWEKRIEMAEYQIVGLSLLLGELSLRNDRPADALPFFRSVLDVVPDHNTALRRIGQVYIVLGDHAMAAEYLARAYVGIEERARRLAVQNSDPETEIEEEETPPAETPAAPAPRDVRERIRALERGAMETAAVVATLHFLAGNPPDCQSWFTRIFALDPTNRFLELKLALTYLEERRLPAAARHLRRFDDEIQEGSDNILRILIDRIENRFFPDGLPD